MTPLTIPIFLFLVGACVGSFLNVVVWRLPRNESLVFPPSHCPACNQKLLSRDNIPIFGWLKLGGRCRFCNAPISKRYPIVETVTALVFVFYYVMYYMTPPAWHIGPCGENRISSTNNITSWPIFSVHLYLLAALLAASLIDAELFIIPTSIIWGIPGGVVWIGLVVHTFFVAPHTAGSLTAGPLSGALAIGGSLGLTVSVLLLRLGKLPMSFAEGAPILDVERSGELPMHGVDPDAPPREYTSAETRREIRKEMLFLLAPLFGALVALLLTWEGGPLHRQWESLVQIRWLSGLLGSIFGALVGGFVVWLTRILGSLGFGREAMGLGDVDLMAGIGAVLGAGPATVAFFLAPFFGIVVALYMFVTRSRRELPYGPYLSLATAFVMLWYCPIADYLTPGLQGLVSLLHGL